MEMKMKHITTTSVLACLVVFGGSTAALAQHDHNSRSDLLHPSPFVASAEITGTQEKQLVDKTTVGHYTVCNSGHHEISLTHGDQKLPVGARDCVAIEAKSIKAAGTNDTARNNVTVYQHHPDR